MPGEHRVVYDRVNRFVCSEPQAVEEVSPQELLMTLNKEAHDPQATLGERLERLASIRRTSELPRPSHRWQAELLSRARRPADGMAAIVGLEAWLQDAQALFVTPSKMPAASI